MEKVIRVLEGQPLPRNFPKTLEVTDRNWYRFDFFDRQDEKQSQHFTVIIGRETTGEHAGEYVVLHDVYSEWDNPRYSYIPASVIDKYPKTYVPPAYEGFRDFYASGYYADNP